MAGQFTDTTIIEANRLFSEEYLGGNSTQKALFTNKTAPIQLKAGDEISLHSGYISEVGAGGDVMEFTGKKKELNRKQIEYSLSSTSNTDTFPDKYLPYGVERRDCENVSASYVVTDNKASIQINYYTNLNGDCHILLPRRFDKQFPIDDNNATHYQTNWTTYDSYAMGEVRTQPNIQHQLSADWHNFHADNTLKVIRRRRLVDNSRMKIYSKVKQAYAAGVNTSDVPGSFSGHHYANPLLYEFIPYREIIDFELPVGYDAPSNIANSITNQMTKTNSITAINASVGTGANAFYKQVSTKLESATYKAFYCANESTFSSSNSAWYNDAAPIWKRETMEYLSCFNYIGVKRSEFFDKGHAMQLNWGEKNTLTYGEIAIADRATTDIVLIDNWDATNLKGVPVLDVLKDFFESQTLYPEFWDYDYNTNVTIDNSRFVHINSSNNASEGGDTVLGQDNTREVIDGTSCPLFVYFDKSRANIYSDGHDDDNLCYGFAKKVLGKIALTTKKIGGIPTTQTTIFNTAGKIPDQTPIGYDRHSSAYGNSHCILYSGTLRASANQDGWAFQDTDANNTLVTTSDLLKFTYLGAQSPLLNFDTVASRFTMSYLHSPERVGMQWAAGLNDDYPVPTDANTECFKLNKTPSHWTYTPDLKPYLFLNKELGKSVYPHNFNFGRFRITDSQTGIFIESFGEGLDERKYFETLWFKLGFSYNQFYTPTKDLRNCQTRIDSITDPNTTLITTNADVTSGNSQSFNVNIFSNEMYTAQCPAVQNAAAKAEDLSVPSITTATNSAIITADNLPTKTKRPYFIVRTSLLGQPTFQGGANSGQLYPVIAIVNKINGYSDFFSLEQNQILYTITKDITISSITTSIHDPDQTLAEVDDNTSVIYKVKRNRNQPNLIENILSSQKK